MPVTITYLASFSTSLWKAGAGPDQRANPDVANSLALTETIDYWSRAPDLYGQSS